MSSFEDLYLAEKNKVRKLEKLLEMSKRREAVLCGDCSGKGYITKNTCILCEHERRLKSRREAL